MKTYLRREALKRLGLGLGGSLLAAPLFSSLQACAAAGPGERQLGVALVGLGNYSTKQLAPALQETRYCRLSGIVTGTPAKAEKWKKQYDLPETNIYSYETFDQIADNDEIDIVYVVLPNAMHHEFTLRAAAAGKHVICEKPMAVSVAECEEMVRACKDAGVKLSVGYRLHFDPFNREMMRLGQEKVHGAVKLVEASFGFRALGFENWRFDHAMAGGGALMDVGVYCIQGGCYTLGERPLSVTATEVKTYEKFAEVDETLAWHMKFPSGAIASCTTSYAIGVNRLFAAAEEGRFELEPAYTYGPLKGWTNWDAMDFDQVNQQAAQMDGFALHLLEGAPNLVPGEMGLRDLCIVEAIYRSVASGKEEAVRYSPLLPD
jgi:predicted dehydrogenase